MEFRKGCPACEHTDPQLEKELQQMAELLVDAYLEEQGLTRFGTPIKKEGKTTEGALIGITASLPGTQIVPLIGIRFPVHHGGEFCDLARDLVPTFPGEGYSIPSLRAEYATLRKKKQESH